MTTPHELLRDLIAYLIDEGIKSVHEHERKPAKIRGCLHGFEMVRDLTPDLETYEAVIDERHKVEAEMLHREGVDPDVYWEYHCATEQIEFVYARLQVALEGGTTVSARALLQVLEFIEWRAMKEIVHEQRNQRDRHRATRAHRT